MKEYGQFCPVAKATEIVGEKWTVLILRELILGSTRYSELQRALSRISPTLLSRRLKMLEQKGLLVRKSLPGQRSAEYHLTACGRELQPLIEVLAVWGMRWARGQMSDSELDVEFLMWDLQRRLQTDKLPGGETVLCFNFDELEKHKTWWLLVSNGEVDLCTENPGREVDLYINSGVRTLVEISACPGARQHPLGANHVPMAGNQPLRRCPPHGVNKSIEPHKPW
jgi:DNA-binding HxlR family transcriptional regulator